MGNCVSAPKGQNSAFEFNLSVGTKAGGRPSTMVEPHIKGRTVCIRSSVSELGVKEDMFFDSQPWLDSDCEEFFSVCGDTPSHGNSPIHQKIFQEPLYLEKSPSKGAVLNSVATGPPVKQLRELFEESFRANSDGDKLGIFDLPPNSPSVSPFNPVMITDQSPNPVKKVKCTQSPQCCIPSLVRSFSFRERRKRMKP